MLFSGLKDARGLFLVLSTLTGLIGSFVYPLMSLFLVQQLDSPPIFIGIYTVSVTIAGLIFSQWLGYLADRGVSARKMFMLAVSGMGFALLIYANATSFWQVLAAGIVLLSVGNAAVPQMLTIARQWAEREKNVDIAGFNASLRAAISLAWIVGPPLGFALAASVGFSGSFYLAAICAVVSFLFAYRFIPEVDTCLNRSKAATPNKISASFWMLGLALTLGASGNILYSSSLPLYTIRELGFDNYTPGLFMGLVACLEIPVMLFSSRLSRRISKTKLIGISFICGMFFYTGIFFSTQVWQFIALQFVNALFYGLFAGVGLTLLQEELPERIGFTSAFYSNSIKIGMMIGTTGTGIIGQFLSFRHVSLGAFTTAFMASVCLILYWHLKKSQPQTHIETDEIRG
ncbi:sugar efflux transporter [Echinimonas agarilytica]|uniref:Sugar efflux transporter n=1 Tax=Echinimonas agarilytica TaxID=1215918 RepID=A0AA42B7B7_9GAMM|nr:sugar efflux transporter [Echinimonas agarilytica]MCM2679720.1 sugar efflux transporter [Echinimonas agarilytica]